MSKWRVYNRHPHGLTHKEKFGDNMIEIKAGQYVLMDYEEAVQFRGQYFPMKMDAMDQQTPESYKCIELKPDDGSVLDEKPKEYVCNMDGKKFASQALLDEYEKQFSDKVIIEPEIEKALEQEAAAKRGRKSNAEKAAAAL